MKKSLMILCCMMAVLSSCAHPRKAEFEAVKIQSQQYYDTGEYQKALDTHRKLHNRYPKDTEVTESYIKMVETIKKQADRSYGKKEYASAYIMYQLLPAYYDDLVRDEQNLSFSKTSLALKIKSTEINLAESTSQHHISSGNLQKGIDVCREIYLKYGKDGQSRKCLVSAASELGEKADAAYSKGEYAEAGKINTVLYNNAKIFKTAAIPTAPDMRALNQKIANCIRHLNRRGLELYRKGELRKALDVWKSILEFDPDNDEIRKTVKTTAEQIKNMQ